MSKTVIIESEQQLDSLLSSSKIVVIDFWAEWCGPCKAIAPVYEQLSSALSRPSKVTFAKVDIDSQTEIAKQYEIRSIPTFKIFKNAQNIETVSGADRAKLSNVIKKIAAEADSDGAEGGFGETSGGTWLGASLPKGYKDVTDQIDVRGLDLLNSDSTLGTVRELFAISQPGSLNGKSKADEKDWVESDTDEQLMLFVPFQSTLKVHSLHLTSLPPKDEAEAPLRPKTIRIYKNTSYNLGFDEDLEPVQEIELKPTDWDEKTGTAKTELRFVKFQNTTSLVLFVVDGEGEGEKTRIDRIRIIGETGEKREMGKLEKIGEGSE